MKVKEEFTDFGITFLKGTVIRFNIFGLHFNENEWQNPDQFIPERFDPSSKYFLKPNGQPRSSFSFIPFGIGAWSCPGRFLAILTLKIYVIVMVLKSNIQVDKHPVKNLSFVVNAKNELLGNSI